MDIPGINIAEIIFMFFFFSISGWAGETIMESIVRRRFVSKGFFKGPYVPVHGVGAFAVYLACVPLKSWPPLVFLAGTILCTIVEYLAALLLENVFSIRGWDYETYPFTKWCHYKRRIALTTSLFFGIVAFCVVYFYWDWGLALVNAIPAKALFIIDVIMISGFLTDAVFTGKKCIKNKMMGIPNKTIGLT
ncbi:hypothetical protein AGMMS49928_18850 [Spirochaetia bacterium]|nr:hypothetical protein AGMMS49928_18850 [Spirochaetia bacterium]